MTPKALTTVVYTKRSEKNAMNIIQVFVVLCAFFSAPSIAFSWNFAWNIDQLIENGAGHNGDPQVTMSGNNVVTVWRQFDGSITHIYSNYSTDGGTTWHTPQLIEDGVVYGVENPQVAMYGYNVVAVWRKFDGSKERIYSNYSTDGGATWHTPQLIEDNATNGVGPPQVAMSENNVVVAWQQREGINSRIYSNYSTDGGATWHADQLIEDNAGYDSGLPRMAISGNNVMVVWTLTDLGSEDSSRLYSNYSTDGGATWHSDQLIEDNAYYSASSPQVAISGNNVVAVWHQNDRIYSSHSTNGGATWHTNQLVQTNGDHDGFGPEVAISGNNVVVVWRQVYGSDPSSFPVVIDNSRIYSNYSTDGGATWHADQLIEDNAGYWASAQRVAMFGNNVVVVWAQRVGANYRIYSNYSTDGGVSWHLDQLIEDNSAYEADSPQVAIFWRNVVTVWSQWDGSNSRIYFNHGVFQGSVLFVPAMNKIGIITFILLIGIGSLFYLRRQRRRER
jgi:Neuraminidase (sialidase)